MEGMRTGDSVFALAGDIDASSAMHLLSLPLPEDATSVVLDLSQVGFVDSYGVTAIIVLAKRVGGELVLANPNQNVASVLTMLGINAVSGIRIEG